MAAYLNARRVRAERGKFADRFTTCKGCGQDLWDVLGKGTHPDDDCERSAARGSRSEPPDGVATRRPADHRDRDEINLTRQQSTRKARSEVVMTPLDMCLWHPACTPIPERFPCPLELGPTLISCPNVTEWLVQDWTQPGVPLHRLCTSCAAHTLCGIPLCGAAECGANGIECPHPRPIEVLRKQHLITNR